MCITETYDTGFDVGRFNLARRASGKSPTVGSLEIAKLDERNGCVGIPLKVARLCKQQTNDWIRAAGTRRRRGG